jgi:sugar phosphate isomerase/epimerase
MYSFSTCWNSGRHTDGRAMLREIRELGFDHAELSHGISVGLVPGILEAVDAGEIKISTVHNFCPLPMGVTRPSPNLFEFSADKDRDRELAVRHTLKTIEFAVRVRAAIVVLHLGSMDLKDYTGKLGEMLERGEKGTPKFQKLCAEAMTAREAKKEKFLDHVRDSLRKILPAAEKHGVKLGLENREAVEELPFESDFELLLREFDSPNVAYWHDLGHAQIKEHLGFISHRLYLESLASRLAGFHVHDLQFPMRDHALPGSGVIDFAALKPLVRPQHVKVFEFSPKIPAEAVPRGVAHIKNIWGAE